MKTHNIQAFTVIELILVIGVLAILSIIAFVSFMHYLEYSRDASRLGTVKGAESGLQIYMTKTGRYPEPDQSFQLSVNGEALGYQGYLGDSVSQSISLNQVPLDPQLQTQYVYRISPTKNQFQILSYMEEIAD